MAEALGPQCGGPPPESRENSTRLDIKLSDARPAKKMPGSDSYEIPVHVTDAEPRAQDLPSTDYGEEMPTATFRPDMNPNPSPPPRHAPAPSPNETRIHQAPPARRAPPRALRRRVWRRSISQAWWATSGTARPS